MVALPHRLRHLSDDPFLKGRLHHAALGFPQLAVTGNKPMTQQHLDALESYPFGVVALIGHQYAFHKFRIVDHVSGLVTRLRLDFANVTKAFAQVLQLFEGFRVGIDFEGFSRAGRKRMRDLG